MWILWEVIPSRTSILKIAPDLQRAKSVTSQPFFNEMARESLCLAFSGFILIIFMLLWCATVCIFFHFQFPVLSTAFDTVQLAFSLPIHLFGSSYSFVHWLNSQLTRFSTDPRSTQLRFWEHHSLPQCVCSSDFPCINRNLSPRSERVPSSIILEISWEPLFLGTQVSLPLRNVWEKAGEFFLNSHIFSSLLYIPKSRHLYCTCSAETLRSRPPATRHADMLD